MSKNRTFAEEMATVTAKANQEIQEKEAAEKKRRAAWLLSEKLEREGWENGTSKEGAQLIEQTVENFVEKARSEAATGAREASLPIAKVFAQHKTSFWLGRSKSTLTPIWGERLAKKLRELGFNINLQHHHISYDCSCEHVCNCYDNVPYITILW